MNKMELAFAFNVGPNPSIHATTNTSFAWCCYNLKESAIFVENSVIDYIFAKNAIFTFARIACASRWSHSLWRRRIMQKRKVKWLPKVLVRAITRSVNKKLIFLDKLVFIFYLYNIYIKIIVSIFQLTASLNR